MSRPRPHSAPLAPRRSPLGADSAGGAGLPLRHPALLATLLVVAACIVASGSFRFFEPDMWQHLLVGKAIWQLRSVPTTQQWTWPTWGAPDVNSSWGFEALLWPFWSVGGIWGLVAWRWLTTLAAFALLWAVARRMGARGLGALFVVALCAVVYRPRTNIRPETLAGVLLALELWILESRRRGAADRVAWLPAVAWAWANVHISYYLGLLVAGVYLLDQVGRPQRARAAGAATPSARPLALALLAAVAVSFLNPFGWRALWQPFDFFLHQRNEPIYRTIGELLPLDWKDYWRQGLPFVMTGWVALLLWRWRRLGLDLAEVLLCAGFTLLAFATRRFVGFYALVAVPFLARDLEVWLGLRRWRWRPVPWVAAALTSLACVAVGLYEWTRPFPRWGLGLDPSGQPAAACDFIARHGVRGRGFNHFHLGGYMLWRFWPERDRLPFMDIHQAGTRDDRNLYAFAQVDRDAWLELDRRHRFDYALLARHQGPDDRLPDWLEADSTWALVFADDAAMLYVRRGGALEPVARDQGFRHYGAGRARSSELGAACVRDPALRGEVESELDRQIGSSPRNAISRTLLGTLLFLDGRTTAAREQLERALSVDPTAPRAWERLGTISLSASEPARALREFRRERALNGPSSMLDFRMGQAWQQLGDIPKARAAYRSAFLRDAGNQPAMDSLQGLQTRERR